MPAGSTDKEHSGGLDYLEAYPFLINRSTDRWFVEEYTSLIPGPLSRSRTCSPFLTIDRKFVIAFTPRVGSTLLCQHLFRYGVFVAEFFNPVHLRAGTHVSSTAGGHDLLNRLTATYAVNGAWGVKAHVQSMVPFFLVGEFPDQLQTWRFVYLTRDNVVRQAISQVIAELRRSWSVWEEPEREAVDSDYSYDRLARTIWSIRRSQESWERFFSLFGIEPLRLSYDMIVADPEAAAAQVSRHCGLEPGGRELVAQFDDPPLAPQTTVLNAEWEQRFRHEAAFRSLPEI